MFKTKNERKANFLANRTEAGGAVFWPTHSFKDRLCHCYEVSGEESRISASAVSYCGQYLVIAFKSILRGKLDLLVSMFY